MELEYYQHEINCHEHIIDTIRAIDSLYGLYQASILLGMWCQESELFIDNPEITGQIMCIIDRYYCKLKTQLESTERKDQNNEIL